jgi:kinesin family protein 5
VRETVDRLRQSQEENEMITRRRDELEARFLALEADYEELLGEWVNFEGVQTSRPLSSRENPP